MYAAKAKRAAHLKGGKVVRATLVAKKKAREEDRKEEIKGKHMLILILRICKRGS